MGSSPTGNGDNGKGDEGFGDVALLQRRLRFANSWNPILAGTDSLFCRGKGKTGKIK